MCEICGGYFCYPSCPSYDGDNAELGRRLYWCSSCGCSIHEADRYTVDGDNVYCEDCTRERGDTEDDEKERN